jgi:hypothetical protein
MERKWDPFHVVLETQPLHAHIICPAVIQDFSWISKSGLTSVVVTAWWRLHICSSTEYEGCTNVYAFIIVSSSGMSHGSNNHDQVFELDRSPCLSPIPWRKTANYPCSMASFAHPYPHSSPSQRRGLGCSRMSCFGILAQCICFSSIILE